MHSVPIVALFDLLFHHYIIGWFATWLKSNQMIYPNLPATGLRLVDTSALLSERKIAISTRNLERAIIAVSNLVWKLCILLWFTVLYSSFLW
jgi:hypothetical protein